MKLDVEKTAENRNETTSCPNSILMSEAQFMDKGEVMVVLPCGLTLGSEITVIAEPRIAHAGDHQSVMVSQFMLELIGSKTVDDEDPPKILHYNPRLKGDWSEKPVIEQNTCYKQQFGTSVRCEGWKSKPDEETGEYFI